MATAVAALLTAEQYAELPDVGHPTELVRGEIVHKTFPDPRHGEICATVGFIVATYLTRNRIGTAVSNNSAVVTLRNPDTVRGPDIAFYSYDRVQRGRLPWGYLPIAPELVFEVRSPSAAA